MTGHNKTVTLTTMPTPESKVMQTIMLALAGVATVFRNNVGARELKDGTYLKYGIGGKGGSDLIGYKSIIIQQCHVGTRFAIFVALEVKAPGGKATPEQEHFIKVTNIFPNSSFANFF